uniref:Uncharacterized protein n=1 Tax=Sphaerodactylus townsendi TaxID=933632 RepID=A0ACB8FRP7_9SAUR
MFCAKLFSGFFFARLDTSFKCPVLILQLSSLLVTLFAPFHAFLKMFKCFYFCTSSKTLERQSKKFPKCETVPTLTLKCTHPSERTQQHTACLQRCQKVSTLHIHG